ncbi:hypothetical protein BBBOND_0111310 [Babesia bigemina]|uniref:Ribosome-binding protein 1 n=1 Tax=Babesia bigemina TaxID=5866 RepID=A0A061D2L2_BABBI|nr:hypothetical protein BBBOND_0111310 [Babesia bigemina]CDR94833.1 hypothetical protein BBBOND_0111310 [Babesia bigemina]|eukprot:XP_012767019.1 hypothetical protein BBBOND_0111310 [Babesia bigemina]
MTGHGIELRTLRDCLQFLEWFKGDTDMQGKVAEELAKRCDTSYNHISYTGRLPDYFIEFLKNVSSFYHKLVNIPTAGNYGHKNGKQTLDALLECLPKFLAALYYIWYNVDYKLDAVGGGKWRDLYVGWENTWWGWGNDYGGGLQTYLRLAGSLQLELIPGGFGPDEVTYGYHDRTGKAYTYGSNMVNDLKNILNKQTHNEFRDISVTSVYSDAGIHMVNTANVLAMVKLFCETVRTDRDGTKLKGAVEEGIRTQNKCVDWPQLSEHCKDLEQQLKKFFNDKAFSHTGQVPKGNSLNTEKFMGETATWFRKHLPAIHSNVKKISIHYPADASIRLSKLQPFVTENLFPYGFIFGENSYGTMGNAWNTLPPKWKRVIGVLKSNNDGLAKLKKILDGAGCKLPKPVAAPAPRSPKPAPAPRPSGANAAVAQGTGGHHNTVHHIVLRGRGASGDGGDPQGQNNQVQGAQQPGPPAVEGPAGPSGQPASLATKTEATKTEAAKPHVQNTGGTPNQNNDQSEYKLPGPQVVTSSPDTTPGATGVKGPVSSNGDRGQQVPQSPLASKPSQVLVSQPTNNIQSPPSPPSAPERGAAGPAGGKPQGSNGGDASGDQPLAPPTAASSQPPSVPPPVPLQSGAPGSGSGRGKGIQAATSDPAQGSGRGPQSGASDSNTVSGPSSGSGGGGAGVGSGGPKKEPGIPKKDLDAERKKRWNAYGLEQQAKRTIDEEKMKSLIQSVNSNLHTIRQRVQEEALRKAVQENILQKTRIGQNAYPNKVNASTCSNDPSMHIGRSICHTNSTMPMPTTTSSHYLTPDVLDKIKIAEEQERAKQDEQRKRQETNDRHLRALHQGIEIETEILKQHAEQPTYPHADRLISEMNERNTKRDALGTVVPIHPGMEAVKLDGKATPSSKGIPRSTFPPISSNIDVPMGYSLKHKAPQWHDPPPPSKPVLQMFRAIPQGIVLNDNHQHRKSASGSRTTVEAPLLSQALEIDPSQIVLNVSGEALKNSTNDDTDLFPAPLTLDATPVPDHMQYKRSVDIYEPAVVKHDVPLTDILPKKRPPPVPAVPKNPFHTRTPFYSELHKPPDSITLFPGDPPSVTQDGTSCTPPWMLSQMGVSKPGRADEMPHMPNDSHSRFLYTDVLPRTVREMLYWLAGLRHSAVYDTLEKYISDLVGNYAKQTESLSSTIETVELAAVPKCIVGNEVTQALRLSCQYSIIVLMGIQGLHDPHIAYKNDNYSKAPQYEYSPDPACLLCQLRDYVYACHHQLQFLKSQCKRHQSHGGWRDCKYGSVITSPNSPLQSFLTDGWDSDFETHLFDPCNPCLKSRVRMGFKNVDLPKTSQLGSVISTILSPSCGGDDPLLTLSSYLNCLTRRTPRTTGELVSYFHYFGMELHNYASKSLSLLGSSLSTSHADCPDWDRLGASDLQAVSGIRGSEALNIISINNHDNEHPRTLSTLVGCGSDSATCHPHCSPTTYRAYALYSQSFAHTYLSWAVYLPDRLWESLEKLHYDLQKHRGSSKCSSLHSCPYALPLLYSHGFTPPEGILQSPLKCADVISKLKGIVNGGPIASLMTAMDEFLYNIREPFIFTLVALWSLASLILANTMLYRLDVLRTRSHLIRTKASHRIDVKALLTKGRKMLSLYKDVDYFDEDTLSQLVVQ